MYSYNVLVVEDEVEALEVFELMLKRFFKNVFTAPDGVMGIEVLKKEKIDLLITDYWMPKMNGLALAKTVKEDFPDIPIIMLTAEKICNEIISCSDHYIQKPFDKKALIEAIDKVIKL